MAEFTYEAMGTSGTRTQGTLVAGSEREVMAMLDARGLFPVRIAVKKETSVGGLGRRECPLRLTVSANGREGFGDRGREQ